MTNAATVPITHASAPPYRNHSPAADWVMTTLPFGPGDQLLFYTDGVSEARNTAGDFYPLSEHQALTAGQEPDTVLDRLQQDVLRHVGHALDDDAAMLLLRREPALVPTGRGGVDQFGAAGSRDLLQASRQS